MKSMFEQTLEARAQSRIERMQRQIDYWQSLMNREDESTPQAREKRENLRIAKLVQAVAKPQGLSEQELSDK